MADLNCDWGYLYNNGPSDWGTLCNQICDTGSYQSPINLEIYQQSCDDYDIGITTANLGVSKYYNTGHTVQLNFEQGHEINLKGINYELRQMHFHIPSEHTIDGKQMPGCYHLVHESKTTPGQYAVIEVMLQVADNTNNGSETNALSSILNDIPATKNAEVTISSVDTKELLPAKLSAYNYQGSFTTPPCTESVEWIVSPNVLYVTQSHLTSLHNIIDVGVRPTQNINGRSITCASDAENYFVNFATMLSSLVALNFLKT